MSQKNKPKYAREWSEDHWNPVKGCAKVDEACRYCYAEYKAAFELFQHPIYGQVVQNGQWNRKVILDLSVMQEPFKIVEPKKIFVCSMSDLLHEDVPISYIMEVLNVIQKASWHTFIILTKRPERFEQIPHWPDNVILSVTVGHSKSLYRIDLLRKTDAKLKFLSIEPLIEELPDLDLNGIDWVAVGGESDRNDFYGSDKIRPMHPRWVRSVRDRCVASGVKFHFKGWQAWLPQDHIKDSPDWFRRKFHSSNYPKRQLEGLTFFYVGGRGVCDKLDSRAWTESPI